MTSLYKPQYSELTQEAARLHVPPPVPNVQARQADSAQADPLKNSLVVFSAMLGLQLGSFLLGTAQPRHKLENHAMCGIPTGGQVGLYCSLILV